MPTPRPRNLITALLSWLGANGSHLRPQSQIRAQCIVLGLCIVAAAAPVAQAAAPAGSQDVLPAMIEQFAADHLNLEWTYDLDIAPSSIDRMEKLNRDELSLFAAQITVCRCSRGSALLRYKMTKYGPFQYLILAIVSDARLLSYSISRYLQA